MAWLVYEDRFPLLGRFPSQRIAGRYLYDFGILEVLA